MFYVIGGSGRQGTAIVRYLAENTSEDIVVFDPRGIDSPVSIYHRVVYRRRAFNDEWDVRQKGATVISCLAPSQNRTIAEHCARFGMNYVDLGGIPEVKEVRPRTVWTALEVEPRGGKR